jgi:anti-sigma28 factor (negative regulator of flagellin synthesis)
MKIEQLRRDVEAGIYQVEAEEVADAILRFFARDPA